MKAFSQYSKPRVAIGHPRLGWGGSEKRVLWGIDALRNDYHVTLITAGEFDLTSLNRYYGTSLKPIDFNVRQAPLPFFLQKNEKAAALRWAMYQRFCRRIAREYDVLISAYGPCDFGVPAIHFLADFTWDNDIRTSLHPNTPGIFYRDHLLRRCYLSISTALRRPSGRDLFAGDDDIIAVSSWMADIVKKKYGIQCRVVNAPVPGTYSSVPYEDKEFGFVCLGRIMPEKRIERIVEILTKIRQRGYEFHLHIIGGIDNYNYGKLVRKLIARNSEWVFYEGRLFGDNKTSLLTKHRFGIHACMGDAFPGAVAEMIKAGCIVFVPSEGGQVDMVNHNLLIYENADDAEKKIQAVLEDYGLQIEIHQHLKQQRCHYSIEEFQNSLREVVSSFITRHNIKVQ